MTAKQKADIDGSTEEKIKDAARKLFMQKGFAATKTRDIAAEAGINLALLNYYFRSKEKLFELIMTETLQQFVVVVKSFFNNEQTTLEEKIETFVSTYMDMLIQQPDFPLFVLSEIRANPEALVAKMGIREFLLQSHFMKQLQEAIKSGQIAPIHPLQFIMNVISLTVFPFVGKPLLQKIGDLNNEQFLGLMQERKKMIPVWIKAMLKGS